MLVRPNREFPTLLLRWRGSALARIWPLLITAGVLSWALVWVHDRYDLTYLELTTTPFTIVGLALSIFLGFRNSACYERWWEGRKLWGGVVNATRSYARQTLTLMASTDPACVGLQRECVLSMVAYAHALRIHLRGQHDHLHELAPFLDEASLEALRPERNRPVALLMRLAERHRQAVDRGFVDRFHLPVLEQTLTTLTDIQGGCERIKNTPVPLPYTELTHRIVALYVLFLPFGIMTQVGDMTPVVVMLVAFCFFGLDSVGSQIENPFEEDDNDLPLLHLSRLIENDLRQSLGDTDLRLDIAPVRGVLL